MFNINSKPFQHIQPSIHLHMFDHPLHKLVNKSLGKHKSIFLHTLQSMNKNPKIQSILIGRLNINSKPFQHIQPSIYYHMFDHPLHKLVKCSQGKHRGIFLHELQSRNKNPKFQSILILRFNIDGKPFQHIQPSIYYHNFDHLLHKLVNKSQGKHKCIFLHKLQSRKKSRNSIYFNFKDKYQQQTVLAHSAKHLLSYV